MNITAVTGDITKIRCDVIVNAANPQLAAGGGVCGAIFRAAGRHALTQACNQIGRCEPGEAVATPAFDLSENGVLNIIHTVGPIWNQQPDHESDRLLEHAYINTLRLAETLNATSIAIPPISTGIYGFPTERAAEIVATIFRTFKFDIDQIQLIALEPEKTAIFQHALTH